MKIEILPEAQADLDGGYWFYENVCGPRRVFFDFYSFRYTVIAVIRGNPFYVSR